MLEAEKWLYDNLNKQIIFFGMGCHAAAFNNYFKLKGMENQVVTVDIICHGSPSSLLWRKYLAIKANSNIEYLNFRDKRNGWSNPTSYIRIAGKEVLIKDYMKIFYNKSALRPSCYKCPYATVRRNVDITIGDYWGIEKEFPDFYNSMGNSVVLIHTDVGLNLFDSIGKNLEYRKSDVKRCLQPNLINPTNVSSERKKFWEDYKSLNFHKMIRKYGHVKFRTRVKRKVLRYISK